MMGEGETVNITNQALCAACSLGAGEGSGRRGEPEMREGVQKGK